MSGSCFLLQLCHQLNYWLQNQLQRVDPARFKAPDIESISSDTLEQQSDPSEPSDVTTENRWNEEKPLVLLAFPPDLIATQLTRMLVIFLGVWRSEQYLFPLHHSLCSAEHCHLQPERGLGKKSPVKSSRNLRSCQEFFLLKAITS